MVTLECATTIITTTIHRVGSGGFETPVSRGSPLVSVTKCTLKIMKLQGCVRYRTYRGVPAAYTPGITGTGYFGKSGTASIPVPDNPVSSIRHQYRYRKLRQVRYDVNTGTGHFGMFDTLSIPVPKTSVSSVRHQCRYRTLRLVRYDINTGTGHFGKFGTTSIPVPDNSVSSVRHQDRYRRYRYARMYRCRYRYIDTTQIPVPNTSVR